MLDRIVFRAAACALLLCLAGCHTKWQPVLNHDVAPATNEAVVLEKLLIVFDGSGSMTLEDKWTTAKQFLRSFIVAMPEGGYQVGARTFGGEWKMDWPELRTQQFDRGKLAIYADELCPVMGSTFLAEALLDYRKEVAANNTRTAVLIVSDGKAHDPAAAREAVQRLREAHLGELCVYTVHVGDDEAGGQLLYDMATQGGCGRGLHVSSLSVPGNLEALVREIFFGERIVPDSLEDFPSHALLFGSGKSYIRPEYGPMLTQFAREMELNPSMRLRIEGHTDDTGGAAQNQAISLQRAEAVKRALVERGVPGDRIEVVGLSDTRPVVPNTTGPNRQLNRRAEILIIQ